MGKDLFSEQASVYAKYRPSYPEQLFDYILGFTEHRDHAWDGATGNGQAAVALSKYFHKIEASDISESQIQNAVPAPNIQYHVCPVEQTPFAANSFDLITIAQAYHWVNWEKFHEEATRVGKQNAVVAVWGYQLIRCEDPRINSLVENFYTSVVGPYWDDERKHVDAAYQTVSFDFEALPSQTFNMKNSWTKEQFIGYLQSWSAVQNFKRKNNHSPLQLIEEELASLWTDNKIKALEFPVFLRIGRIRK